MNENVAISASNAEKTIEKVLNCPMNTNTAICVMFGIAVAALLINKAMEIGYDVEIGNEKIKFAQPVRSQENC